MNAENFENLRLELRRGSLVIAVLAALHEEQYGYTLRKKLSSYRLESQGLLTSEWREENKRNKRFYRLAREGESMLSKLMAEWRAIDASVAEILKESVYGPDRAISARG
jgi:PadR family transcriptional regulator PadR